MKPHARSTVTTAALALGLAASLTLTAGCTKSESGSDDAGSKAASGGGQEVAQGSGGKTCTIDDYGAKKIDLKNATVGFSQSEKEANPFRIAETASIKAEASKRGVKLLTANAQSQFSKQISDVQDLLAKGADLLIIAPLNSDGWEPVLKAGRGQEGPDHHHRPQDQRHAPARTT